MLYPPYQLVTDRIFFHASQWKGGDHIVLATCSADEALAYSALELSIFIFHPPELGD